jgi:hypothetical protein
MLRRKRVLLGVATLVVIAGFVQTEHANAQSSGNACYQRCQAQRKNCLSFPDVYVAVCDQLHKKCAAKCAR